MHFSSQYLTSHQSLMTKIMSTPSGWTLSPTNAKNHVFFCTRSFRVEDSDSTKKSRLTLPMNPRCVFDEKLAMSQQAQSVYDGFPSPPSKEEFKSRLKTTPFVYPNALQPYLWVEHGMNNIQWCGERVCFLLLAMVNFAELYQLARTKLYGQMKPDLIAILDEMKANPTRSLKIRLNGTQSDATSRWENTFQPIMKSLTDDIFSSNDTQSLSTENWLSFVGGKQGGVDIKAELCIKDVEVGSGDILLIWQSRLFIAGAYTNIASMMASYVIMLFAHYAGGSKCHSPSVLAEALTTILTMTAGDESMGAVVVVTANGKRFPKGFASKKKVELTATRIEIANLRAECEKNGKIGKIATNCSGILQKGKAVRKEFEDCPQFKKWAESCKWHN